jgi:hypothetical protein
MPDSISNAIGYFELVKAQWSEKTDVLDQPHGGNAESKAIRPEVEHEQASRCKNAVKDAADKFSLVKMIVGSFSIPLGPGDWLAEFSITGGSAVPAHWRVIALW